MTDSMLKKMKASIDEWYRRKLEYFDLEDEPDAEVLLAYHNYVCWHYEEALRGDLPERIVPALRRTFDHNLGRNLAVEAIDDRFFATQKGTGEYHSETPGMLLDRISIIYLKIIHCPPADAERLSALEEQDRFLCRCYLELVDGLASGRKQMFRIEKTKHFS